MSADQPLMAQVAFTEWLAMKEEITRLTHDLQVARNELKARPHAMTTSSQPVSRFTWTRPDDQRALGYMQRASHGEYVQFNDYDSREGNLLAEIERLAAELERIAQFCQGTEACKIAREALARRATC